MKTLPGNIFARPHGYEVLIKRRELKWRALVPYTHPQALAEAIRLRDRFARLCGPIARTTPRSNTEILGISETIHWKGVTPLRNFIAHVEGKNKRFYYGQRRTREQALQAAVTHRAKSLGVQPSTLLPHWP